MDDRTRELIDKWSAGAPLSEEELAELRAADTIDADERCVLSAAAGLAARDRGVDPAEIPPADLEERIMAAVSADAAVSAGAAGIPGRNGKVRSAGIPTAARRALQLALPAAVLVIGFLLGVGYARSAGSSGRSAGIPAPDTVTVTFRLAAPEATSVALVGDFNKWRGDSFRMTNDKNDGVWEITIPLHRGHVYTYNFLIDGDRWISDPDSLYQVKDGFGGEKSVIQL